MKIFDYSEVNKLITEMKFPEDAMVCIGMIMVGVNDIHSVGENADGTAWMIIGEGCTEVKINIDFDFFIKDLIEQLRQESLNAS